jgi:hypothetical protein
MITSQERTDAVIDLKAALAHREIRVMGDSARKYIDASLERYNRSAGQSRRQWKIRSKTR